MVINNILNYMTPIYSFLLVFIVVFVILKKTKILGERDIVSIIISFIMASFFIVEVQLVDYIKYTSSWMVALAVIVFLIMVVFALMPGKNPFEFLLEGNWLSIVIVALVVLIFVLSSSYIFNWAFNWNFFASKAGTDWFKFILLMVIAGVASIILVKSK